MVKPVITGELPLEKAADAHKLLEGGAAFGRMLLRPGLRASV
jgi:NADPH:quinone reductase-like Zn-dependent oxidoreductase